jgi:iron complex outermembrane receptor protein
MRHLIIFLTTAIAVIAEEPVELDPYYVLVFDESSYGSRYSFTATRFAAKNEELPLLVNVVSSFLLEEQQVIDPGEAFENISNVEAKVATSGQTNQVAIRGFDSFTYIDGFRVGNSNSSGLGGISLATEVANIERIEVLKGPAATLYGRGLPGGVVNYITKKPQLERHTELTAQFGNNALLRTVADTAGAVDSEAKLQYRLIASVSDRESYRDEVEQSAVAAYPSLFWQINQSAELLLRVEYQKVKYTPDQGALFLSDGSEAGASSRSFFYGSKGDEIDAEQFGLNAQFEAELPNHGVLRTLVGYRHFEQSGTATLGTEIVGNNLNRVTETLDESREDWLAQIDYMHDYEHSLFSNHTLRHQILLSADWQRSRTLPESSETPLDLLDIGTGQTAGPSFAAGPPNDFSLLAIDYGFGVQDLITVDERLHLLLGLRYDRSQLEYDLSPFPFEGDLSLHDWSYRIGAIYQLTDAFAVFANFGTAFRPSFRINAAGQSLFELQESVQYEAGTKLDLFDGRLLLNAAVFHLTNKDVVLSEAVSTDQESIGAEIDLTARIGARTTLLFNYGMIDTEYTDGIFEGNRLAGAPARGGGLWLNHDLIAQEDRRLSFSLGLNYKGRSYATDANEVELPDACLVDAGLHYKTGNWRFSLNAYNLLNEATFTASPNQNVGDAAAPVFALPTAPTSLRLSASYRF